MTPILPPRRAGAGVRRPGLGRARTGRAAARRSIAVGVATAIVFALVAACSSTSPTGSGDGGGSGAPAGSGVPTPKPTTWPTTVVEASIALGGADGDFAKLAADLQKAVDAGDPAEILSVINNGIEFLTENQKNIPRLQAYDTTKAVGDRVAAAYQTMIDGATEIRDGLESGNGGAVTHGFTIFAEGNEQYQAVRAELGDLAEQAFFMKRQLLR
jgi:hypothetical protein